MTREQILIELKQLSLPDKMSVLAVLTHLVEVDEHDCKYKTLTDMYVDKMKELVGNDFMQNNHHGNVNAKIVLSVCLREQGLSLSQIGRLLNRDHSTISSYKRIWNNALAFPRAYRDIIELYNKYKKTL